MGGRVVDGHVELIEGVPGGATRAVEAIGLEEEAELQPDPARIEGDVEGVAGLQAGAVAPLIEEGGVLPQYSTGDDDVFRRGRTVVRQQDRVEEEPPQLVLVAGALGEEGDVKHAAGELLGDRNVAVDVEDVAGVEDLPLGQHQPHLVDELLGDRLEGATVGRGGQLGNECEYHRHLQLQAGAMAVPPGRCGSSRANVPCGDRGCSVLEGVDRADGPLAGHARCMAGGRRCP